MSTQMTNLTAEEISLLRRELPGIEPRSPEEAAVLRNLINKVIRMHVKMFGKSRREPLE